MPEAYSEELERRGIELAKSAHYSEARAVFERVLPTRTVPLHRGQVLQNIMLTYLGDDRRDLAENVARKILDLPGISDNREGAKLIADIQAFLEGAPGTLEGTKQIGAKAGWLPLATVWYAISFFAGLYWGVTFGSGGITPIRAFLFPPLVCIGMALVGSREKPGIYVQRVVWGATSLYINFLLTFGVGFALANAGLLRFQYLKAA
jgi:hypothetical protein